MQGLTRLRALQEGQSLRAVLLGSEGILRLVEIPESACAGQRGRTSRSVAGRAQAVDPLIPELAPRCTGLGLARLRRHHSLLSLRRFAPRLLELRVAVLQLLALAQLDVEELLCAQVVPEDLVLRI